MQIIEPMAITPGTGAVLSDPSVIALLPVHAQQNVLDRATCDGVLASDLPGTHLMAHSLAVSSGDAPVAADGALVGALAAALTQADPLLADHSRRVADLAGTIVRTLGASALVIAQVTTAAKLHDLGKLALPPVLLQKPGPLTAVERDLVEQHAVTGANWLAHLPALRLVALLIRHHHEHWDGSGYPGRLAGTAIPFGARVIAVADAFDALTSDRPYRRAYSVADACVILRAGRGTTWDPSVVDVLLRLLGAPTD